MPPAPVGHPREPARPVFVPRYRAEVTARWVHELPPRLPRRRLRRCGQARGAGAPHRAAEAEGHRLPRHRHPCRHRPLRSHRRRGDALGRMAGGHRPAVAAATSPPALAALLAPLMDAVKAANDGGETLAPLSRLAVDRAPPLPPAGPADRGRAAPGRRQGARRRASPATSRCAPSPSTAGWRSAPSCRPRSGAGWCWSIRPTRRPTSSTASLDALRQRPSALADRHLCPLVSGQGPRRRRPAARRRSSRAGIRRLLRAELFVRERERRRHLQRRRPHHLQSAVAVRRDAGGAARRSRADSGDRAPAPAT